MYLYKEKGWDTLMLYSYGLRYHRNCLSFPRTVSLLEPLPELVTLYYSELAPQTSLSPHYGDTDSTHRIHLGLIIPGRLPECGIEVGGEKKTWEAGKCIVFNDAHYHRAWNHTDETRLVLIADVIRPPLMGYKNRILTEVLGTLAAGRVMYLLGILHQSPIRFKRILERIASVSFTIILPLQRKLKILY